jgi:hypothetical protein
MITVEFKQQLQRGSAATSQEAFAISSRLYRTQSAPDSEMPQSAP